jgi:hypothetical protein
MEHEHKRFDEELLDLRQKVTERGGLVVEQIESALRCFTELTLAALVRGE